MDKLAKDILERAIKTFCQALIAGIGMAVAIEDVDWEYALSTALLATILSVLTSVVSTEFGDTETASLVDDTPKKKTTKKPKK